MHTESEIRIEARIVQDLVQSASDEFPREACGLLVGTRNGANAQVHSAPGARNLARSDDQFELDPSVFMMVDLAAREAGLEILGLWHSHPRGRATPSELDRTLGVEGWIYIIVSLAQSAVARAWRVEGGEWREIQVRTHPSKSSASTSPPTTEIGSAPNQSAITPP